MKADISTLLKPDILTLQRHTDYVVLTVASYSSYVLRCEIKRRGRNFYSRGDCGGRVAPFGDATAFCEQTACEQAAE
jgi:hypothetical protein